MFLKIGNKLSNIGKARQHFVFVFVCTYVCMSVYLYICGYGCVPIHVCVYTCVYGVSIRVYECVLYLCVYTYMSPYKYI